MRARFQDAKDKNSLVEMIAHAAMSVVGTEFARIRLSELETIIEQYRNLDDLAFDKWLAERRRAFRKVPKPPKGLREAYDKAHPRA